MYFSKIFSPFYLYVYIIFRDRYSNIILNKLIKIKKKSGEGEEEEKDINLSINTEEISIE